MTAATVNAADPARWPEAKVWMQAARALSVERHPYLDTALTTMFLVERPGLRSVAVDARWRIYYDPQRTLELVAEYGIDALTADWVHEVMHLLRHHHARWESLHDAPQFMAQFNIALMRWSMPTSPIWAWRCCRTGSRLIGCLPRRDIPAP